MTPSRPNGFDPEEPLPRGTKSVRASVPNLNESTNYQPDRGEISQSVEFSAPLENSVSLEAPRAIYRNSPRLSALQPEEVIEPGLNASKQSVQVAEEVIISLLEERLVVDRHKRKVGEVVVRKEIETYIVEVPVRREKLIVEQVSPEYKQLAVVDLGQSQDQKTNHLDSSHPSTVSANFTSASAAIEFLEAIAIHPSSGSTTVQVSVVLTDKNMQTAYQNWLRQHST